MWLADGRHGLYEPRWEHDGCGIGAVVDISGRSSHAIVEHGRQILLNLRHRGASSSDDTTGDGAGQPRDLMVPVRGYEYVHFAMD